MTLTHNWIFPDCKTDYLARPVHACEDKHQSFRWNPVQEMDPNQDLAGEVKEIEQ